MKKPSIIFCCAAKLSNSALTSSTFLQIALLVQQQPVIDPLDRGPELRQAVLVIQPRLEQFLLLEFQQLVLEDNVDAGKGHPQEANQEDDEQGNL